ncbi:hypothetical protein F5887DRAFT_190233 [Amanita rubescens]|nr:hypothetical protein F5887DRAFT_190233 [Amanita rubescens]
MVFPIAIVRLLLFVLVTILSGSVLGLGSQLLNVMNPQMVSDWGAVNVAIAALTVSSLPTLIVVSLVHKAAFLNYVIVELVWLTVVWALWLTSAVLITMAKTTFYSLPGGCEFGSGPFALIWDNASCGRFWVILYLSWIIWFKLMAYIILLLVLTINQQMRGNRVWNKSVTKIDFFAPRPGIVIQLDAVRAPDMDIKFEALE